MRILSLITAASIGLSGSILALHDLANLGKKQEWSNLDNARVKSYLVPLGVVGAATPSIGPTKGIHHWAKAGQAYINGELPEKETMDFFRESVMNSAGTGKKGDDFRSKFQRHEDIAMKYHKQKGQKTYISNITQTVPFYRYGVPLCDTWAIQLRTDIVDGKPKSAFVVWGLGIVVDHRNPNTFGPQFDSMANIVGLEGEDFINWTTKVEKEGLAKPYWVFITDNDNTSKFSHSYVNTHHTKRKSYWNKSTKIRHNSGHGYSVDDLYKVYSY